MICKLVFTLSQSLTSFERHAIVLREHLSGLLLEALRDQDVGVEEALHAVAHAVLGARVQLLRGAVALRARVPALLRQLVDDGLNEGGNG